MAKANAYSTYVKEIANQRRRRGENVNFNLLFSELDSSWRSMSEAERQKYKDRSKQPYVPHQAPPAATRSPTTTTNNNNNSNNNAGSSNGAVQRIENNKRPRDADALALVEPTQKRLRPGVPNARHYPAGSLPALGKYFDFHLIDIRNKCRSLVKTREKKLMDVPFYSISVNVLCRYKPGIKDDPREEDFIYVPIEIGIYAYTVGNGQVGEPYHCLINPGAIPRGTVTLAMEHSENTHKISLPLRGYSYPGQARDDYKKIYREISKYTEEGEKILLVDDKRAMEQVRGCIDWLYNKGTEDGTKLLRPSQFTIYPAVEYIAAMDSHIWQNMYHQPFPITGVEYFILMSMENSTHDFVTAYMCDYHKQDDVQTKWCARLCAMKTFKSLEKFFEERIASMYKLATARPTLPSTIPTPLAIQQ